jgi:hypothetical protein
VVWRGPEIGEAELTNSISFNIGKQEGRFSLLFDAAQAGGVVQGLVAKSLIEVAPKTAPVLFSLPAAFEIY